MAQRGAPRFSGTSGTRRIVDPRTSTNAAADRWETPTPNLAGCPKCATFASLLPIGTRARRREGKPPLVRLAQDLEASYDGSSPSVGASDSSQDSGVNRPSCAPRPRLANPGPPSAGPMGTATRSGRPLPSPHPVALCDISSPTNSLPSGASSTKNDSGSTGRINLTSPR